MRDDITKSKTETTEIVDDREAREVVGAGESFGSLLHVKRLSDRGASPVMLQGCGSDGGSSACV